MEQLIQILICTQIHVECIKLNIDDRAINLP